MSSFALPMIADGGLTKYLAEIRKLPILEVNEEYMLAKRWREHEDIDAAHRLVTSHLRLVAKMAMGYRHYGLPMADLISEGNLGLMRAVKKFDPDVGVRLATYAMWWIKASLHEYLLNSWSMVKIGTVAAHRKLFFNLRRLKSQLGILESGDLSIAQAREIAEELQVSEGDVVNMNRRLSARDTSLNTPVGANSEVEIQDLLADDCDNQEVRLAARQEARLRSQALSAGLAQLTDRERHIVTERHLREDPMTLEDLGKHFGVSRERVRQIEARAMAKLRTALTAAA